MAPAQPASRASQRDWRDLSTISLTAAGSSWRAWSRGEETIVSKKTPSRDSAPGVHSGQLGVDIVHIDICAIAGGAGQGQAQQCQRKLHGVALAIEHRQVMSRQRGTWYADSWGGGALAASSTGSCLAGRTQVKLAAKSCPSHTRQSHVPHWLCKPVHAPAQGVLRAVAWSCLG